MEPMDDFDSLLRAVAEEYNKRSFTERDVSNMIDARLTASKRKLDLQFKTEINIIIGCLLFITLIECVLLLKKGVISSSIVMIQHIADICGMLYALLCLFMFKKLRSISASQKDMHIRDYVKSIYERTQEVIRIYLWASTAITIALIGVELKFYMRLQWSWAIVIWLVLSVLVYYANVWYVRKRFGKRVQEMKELITEFE